ncbi:MAG: hypothetical protein IKY41_01695 [Clostridia bacterium]|nr:hypothetical protein [Clostridia bacterium]
MDKVITEIIIGAVILTLLISIIPIYRSSAALVSTAGEKNDINENIKEVTFGRIPESGDIVSGGYLSEFILYASKKYKIELSVELPDGMHVICNNSKKDWFNVVENNMLFKIEQSEFNGEDLKIYFVLCEEENL